MGYTVLYIAFGVVALWLLGEVLLQYKARLRWRLLAFAGFLGVVAGVYLSSVIVIALGAAAFGTGQTFVTLSYRRGFTMGWALAAGRKSKPAEPTGGGRRRRAAGDRTGATADPALEVSPVEQVAVGVGAGIGADAAEAGAGYPQAAAGAGYAEAAEEVTAFGVGYDPASYVDGTGSTQVFQPMPMHDDSGEFAVYDGRSSYTPDPYTSGGYEGYGAQGYGGWGGEQQQQPAAAASYDSYGWSTQNQGDGQAIYGGQQGQTYDPNYTDPYAGQYHYDTPPGGVWTPQQPDDQQQPYIPQQPQGSSYQQPQYTADPQDPYRYQG